MPVSKKRATNALDPVPPPVPPTSPRAATVKMLKSLLIGARGNYVVWGRMMQGVSGINNLIEADMTDLLKIIDRWHDASVK